MRMRLYVYFIVCITVGFLMTAGVLFAQPVFSPGETLNPDCAPGQTGFTSGINGNTGDCSILLDGVSPTNGLRLISGDIGIGAPLNEDTTIDLDTFNFNIEGEGFIRLQNEIVGTDLHGYYDASDDMFNFFGDGILGGALEGVAVGTRRGGATPLNTDIYSGLFIGDGLVVNPNMTDGFALTSGDLNATSANVSILGGINTDAIAPNDGEARIDIVAESHNDGPALVRLSSEALDTGDAALELRIAEGALDRIVRLSADGAQIGDYTLPWTDGNAGEVLTTDGLGNIAWSLVNQSQNTERAIESNLASARGAELLPDNESFVIPGVQQIHEIVLLGDYIYGSTRSDPAQLVRVHQDDLTDYTVVDFPGEKDSERIVYDEVTGKLYQIFADTTYVDPRVAVYEIDPQTLTTSIVVDHTWPTGSGAAVLDTDGEYIYAIQGNTNPRITKFDIITGVVAGEYQITSPVAVGHNIEHHDGYVYATSSFGTPFFVKVDTQSMTLADTHTPPSFMPGPVFENVITPSMLFIDEYVYIAYEFGDRTEPDASSYVLRYNASDLSAGPTVIDLGFGSGINGMAFDGEYIWFTHNDADVSGFPPVNIDSYISRLDPVTLEYSAAIVDVDSIYKIRTDGDRFFVAGFPFDEDAPLYRFNRPSLFDVTGIAGIVGGGRFTAEPKRGVFTFIVPEGLLQRKFIINQDGVQVGDYTFPWTDGSPGSVLVTDGGGDIQWRHIDQATTTNYRLARELNIEYRDENTQTVSIPEFDDPSFGGSHALVYIAQHDILFSSVRSEDPAFIRFNNPDDLTDYDYVALTGVGDYNNPDQLVYSSDMDKVYMILSDFDYSGLDNFRIVEIDPVTLDYSIIIDESSGQGFIGAPTITLVGTDLYALSGELNSVLRKFDLTHPTTPIPSSASITLFDADRAGHALETDGTHLYATSIFGSTQNQLVARIDLDLTTAVQEEITVGTQAPFGGFTDDMLVWGDYIYILSEGIASNTYMYKVNKNDLSDYVALDIGSIAPEGLQSIMSDGTYIWFSGPNSVLGNYDPLSGEGTLYDTTKYQVTNLNEMATDGSRYFFAGFNAYPVSAGQGRVIRTAFPSTPIQKFTLDNNGAQVQSVDLTTGQSSFSRSGSGDVANFENADGDCVINPNIGVACSSDEDLKKDIEVVESSQLQGLLSIAPRTYRWLSQSSDSEKTLGFLAQEIQNVFPELISKNEETGSLRVAYAGLTVPLVGAVQELHMRLLSIEALQDWSIGETGTLREFVMSSLKVASETVMNGVLRVFEIIADRITARRITTQELCIDDICISRDEFKDLLDQNNITPLTTDNEMRETPVQENNNDDSQGDHNEADSSGGSAGSDNSLDNDDLESDTDNNDETDNTPSDNDLKENDEPEDQEDEVVEDNEQDESAEESHVSQDVENPDQKASVADADNEGDSNDNEGAQEDTSENETEDTAPDNEVDENSSDSNEASHNESESDADQGDDTPASSDQD